MVQKLVNQGGGQSVYTGAVETVGLSGTPLSDGNPLESLCWWTVGEEDFYTVTQTAKVLNLTTGRGEKQSDGGESNRNPHAIPLRARRCYARGGID